MTELSHDFTTELVPLTNLRISQLVLADLPARLLNEWTNHPQDGYTLERWQDTVPDAELLAFVQLYDVMNSAPRENLKLEGFKLTPELWRQQEQRARAARRKLPGTVHQGHTGVDPAHRGHGLAGARRPRRGNCWNRIRRPDHSHGKRQQQRPHTEDQYRDGLQALPGHDHLTGRMNTVLTALKEN